jgi:hypothetical protein
MTKKMKTQLVEEAVPLTEEEEIAARHVDLIGFSENDLIKEYLKLRNWKEQQEEEFEAHIKLHAGDRMKRIEAIMLGRLDDMGMSHCGKKGVGTAIRQVNASCKIVDPLAFQQYVVSQEEWDAIDWRANKTYVKEEWIEKQRGNPPGVEYQLYPVVRFRKG